MGFQAPRAYSSLRALASSALLEAARALAPTDISAFSGYYSSIFPRVFDEGVVVIVRHTISGASIFTISAARPLTIIRTAGNWLEPTPTDKRRTKDGQTGCHRPHKFKVGRYMCRFRTRSSLQLSSAVAVGQDAICLGSYTMLSTDKREIH